VIICIRGDSTSAEGSTLGTPFDLAAIQGINVPVAEQLKFYDVWGSDVSETGRGRSMRPSSGWRVVSHFGDTRGDWRSPADHRKDAGGIALSSTTWSTSLPTILETWAFRRR
jgi:arylsulfatase